MTELELATETLELFIRLLLERLPATGGYPSDEEGELTNLSLYYRLRGIAQYLATGDTEPYVADLHRSGQARLHYLQGCAQGLTGTERFYRTSRNRAFFDCIAINDLSTAEVLAELCDDRWVEALEYEDDFLFVQFLQVFSSASSTCRPWPLSGWPWRLGSRCSPPTSPASRLSCARWRAPAMPIRPSDRGAREVET